jgi:hypothetical protein
MFLQERAFEKYFAACTATVAVSSPQGELFNHFLFFEVGAYKPAKFAMCLSGAKASVYNRSGAKPLRKFFVKRPMAGRSRV